MGGRQLTAPIVWHESRMTVPKRELRVLSNRASSTNRRARHLASSDLLASGQLWERLAER